MHNTEFYQRHLDRVSRSFAYCIARLNGELRDWVGLSYLMCRILDTIEDSKWFSAKQQEMIFNQFELFITRPFDKSLHQSWIQNFSQKLPEGERLLIESSAVCFEDFQNLPAMVREKLQRTLLNMKKGMLYFIKKNSAQGGLRLKTLCEVNQYCFFVAGIVGELLTGLLGDFRKGQAAGLATIQTTVPLTANAYHFGLFLQKINLLKDQQQDEKDGRFLVPSRIELQESLLNNANGAFAYLESIPVNEKGYRLFCAWSLFLGLSSLPWINKSFILVNAQKIAEKIPKLVAQKLFSTIEGAIDDTEALRRLFMKYRSALVMVSGKETLFLQKSSTTSSSQSGLPSWFSEAYQGPFTAVLFYDLGL